MDKEFLGNYKIIRKIGEGGMAIAYLAHHKQIADHKVVLKLLKDPRHGEKFKKEANNLARLNDNNHICRIYDFFNDGDRTIIVMEFIEGASLNDIIKAEKLVPLNLCLKLGVDLLRVIKYAHNRKMYHRDIKPGNLMVDKQGELKVIDFGIAKDATDPNETAAGVFSGTPMYAPLEQFDPMRKVDWGKADIYAIGTTLYRMLTGRMPFDGDDWDAYSENKRLAEPYPPSKFNPNVSPQLDAVILKSIARLPEDRYDNVDEMLKQFESQRSDSISGVGQFDRTVDMDVDPEETYVPGSQRSVAPATTPPPVPAKKKGKTKLIVISLFLLVAIPLGIYAYFGAGAWFITRPKNPGTTSLDTNQAAIKNGNTAIPKQTSAGQDSTGKKQSEPANNSKPEIDTKKTTDNAITPVKQTPGTVSMTIEPMGDIFLNNEKIADGQKSYNLDLPPGDYALKIVNASKEYDSTIVQNFKISALETKNFAFSFSKKDLYGFVRVGSWPRNATIYVDNKLYRDPTPAILRLSPGTYNVRVRLESRNEERESTMVVVPGDTAAFQPEFE